MTYTALYRRYRPDKFSALIGQEHVAKVLATAARRGSFVHAYLFCGPRGTGKTSAARILSRVINCQHPTAEGEPCNECESCKRALAGDSLDLIEIDSASNRGIDEIRDLRERVKYAPAQEKRKIYIIDEVHMLTNEAFNALLKTLEEPPAHVIFILATTAPHKLPLTVLSRCQRFDFRRIGDNEICRHLLDIAAAENIPITPEAAALIAKKADGGMRDAVSLLDQCSGAAQGEITTDLVTMLLGIVDHSFIMGLQQHLLDKNVSAALQDVEALINSGKDLRQAVGDLCESLRDSLLTALADQRKTAKYPPSAYLDLLTALADTDNKLRFAASPRITLELALLKACGLQSPPAPPKTQPAPCHKQAAAAPKTASVPEAQPMPRQPSVTGPKPELPGRSGAKTAPPPVKQQAEETADKAVAMDELWGKILEQLEEDDRCVYFRVEDCRLLQTGNRRLLLRFPMDRAEDYRSVMGSQEHKSSLESAIGKIWGENFTLQAEIGDFLSPPEEEPEEFRPTPEAVPEEAEEKAPSQGSLFQ